MPTGVLSEFRPMNYRTVGQTNLKFSRMGLGSAAMSGFRGHVSEDEIAATFSKALHEGITYYDTAPYYGYGRNELQVGRALRELPRESFVLSTKIGRVMEPLDRSNPPEDLRQGGLPFQPRFDYSAAGAERSLDQSRMRLGIPEIDIALIHDVDVFTHGSQQAADRRYEEAMKGCYPYLEELRKQGTIKAIGVGLNEWQMSLRFAQETDIDCILLAGRYTLLDQGALRELLPFCQNNKISIILGGPFNSGVLATGLTEAARYNYGEVPEAIRDRYVAIQKVCQRHQVNIRSAALQFCQAHPAITCLLPGVMNVRELEQNFQSLAEPIPDQFWWDLKEDSLLDEAAPVPTKTN